MGVLELPGGEVSTERKSLLTLDALDLFVGSLTSCKEGCRAKSLIAWESYSRDRLNEQGYLLGSISSDLQLALPTLKTKPVTLEPFLDI